MFDLNRFVNDMLGTLPIIILYFLLGLFVSMIIYMPLLYEQMAKNDMCSFTAKGTFDINSLGEGFKNIEMFKGIRINEFSATVPCAMVGYYHA